MKSPFLSHILWALVAIVTFSVGYFAGDTPGLRGATEPASTAAVGGKDGKLEEPGHSAGERAVAEARGLIVLTREQARVQAFAILSEPNRIARLRHICDLFEHVTAENWREVKEAFLLQTTKEGRQHETEWYLMLERVGEVAGAEAMNDALKTGEQNQIDRARSYFAGWAGVDPQAAHTWFDAQTPILQQQLLGTLLKGMALSDPKQALALALTQPERQAMGSIRGIVTTAMQHGGFREVEDLLASVAKRADVSDDVKHAVFGPLLSSKLHSLNTAQEPGKILAWFEPHLGQTYVDTDNTALIIAEATKAGAPAVLDWFSKHADKMSEELVQVSGGSLAREWMAKEPEQFIAWMAANPQHPQHEAMAEVTALSFLNNEQIEEAQQWNANIRDPAKRAMLEQVIKFKQDEIKARTNRSKPAQ